MSLVVTGSQARQAQAGEEKNIHTPSLGVEDGSRPALTSGSASGRNQFVSGQEQPAWGLPSMVHAFLACSGAVA